MVESCLFIQYDNLYLLIKVIRPFTFNMIIDIVRFKSLIMLFVFYFFQLFFVPSCLFFCLLLD